MLTSSHAPVDVLLTHSYHLAFDEKQQRRMEPYRPLGTLYAASALREAGFSVALFDTMLLDPGDFTAALDRHQPRMVVIYEDDFNFLTKMCLTRMRAVAFQLADYARSRRISVVAHGSDATDNPELFLRAGITYVLSGEAEASLVELCAVLLGVGGPLHTIPGLAHLDCGGALVQSVERLAKNPGWVTLAEPPAELTDFALYRSAWQQSQGRFSVNMAASRGCPYRCNWCAKPISGNRFHLRPPVAVATEMHRLKTEAGAEHIWFGDDVFALNHRWTQEFAAAVIERDAALPFKIQSRADLMTPGTVDALKQAGCAEVWLGVESGSQRILDAMDKGLRLEQVQEARQLLAAAGVRVGFFLQLGYPGEGWTEIQQTIAFVRDTRPDAIGVSVAYPLPGTPFYARVEAELGAKRNWADSGELAMLFQGTYTGAFYRSVRDALHAENDSWNNPGNNPEQTAAVARGWNEVAAAEPFSLAIKPQSRPYLVKNLAASREG